MDVLKRMKKAFRKSTDVMVQDFDEAGTLIRKHMIVAGVIGMTIGMFLFTGGVAAVLGGMLLGAAGGAAVGFVTGYGSSDIGNYMWGLPSRRQWDAMHEMRAETARDQILEAHHVTPEEYAIMQARMQDGKAGHADQVAMDRTQVAQNSL